MATTLVPFFAPLSRPLLDQAIKLENATPVLLRERFKVPRRETFHLMQPIVQQGEFTTEYLLDKLSEYTPKREHTKPLSAEALSKWRASGLVVYDRKNLPNPDSGAALITLRRLIQDRERRWLPTPPKGVGERYFEGEPLWWCWRQDSLSSPITICPIPLPEDLPASSLLWTDWLGAAWRPEWFRIGDLGCCRWGQTRIVNDTLIWAVQEEDLAQWGIPISGIYKTAFQHDMTLTLHTLATAALLQQATERLEQAQAFELDSIA